MKCLCIIGGFDPTGHAGILRDLKTVNAMGIDAHVIITALTAQNDQTYFGTSIVSPKGLAQQWAALPLGKISVIKIGMLASAATLRFLIVKLTVLKKKNPRLKIVWDPVFHSSSGGELLSAAGIRFAVKTLTLLCSVVTPNAAELPEFVSAKIDNPEAACREFWRRYQVPVYLKGGHLPQQSRDWFFDGEKITVLDGRRSRKRVRGTGCFFASAVAGGLAQGKSLIASCRAAKKMIAREFR